jgi:pimeloyl-ACP methyl ester carboxylesterase
MRAPALSSLGTRPPLWREARIGLEAAALVRDPIFRGDGMADGRGHPVLLVPGFLAGDGSLSPMAGWLKRAGYRPSRAGIVSNVNCAGVLMPRLEKRLERLVSLQSRRAAIVGQSRGGTLAKVLAHRRPDLVSGVVALGSPHVSPLAVHPLVRLQVEAVSRLGSLGAPGLFKRSCLDGARGAAAGRRPAGLGLFEERRHRGLALLPRPARDRARRDQGHALRDGGVARGVASGRRRARALRRGRGGAPPGGGCRGAQAAAGGVNRLGRAAIRANDSIEGVPGWSDFSTLLPRVPIRCPIQDCRSIGVTGIPSMPVVRPTQRTARQRTVPLSQLPTLAPSLRRRTTPCSSKVPRAPIWPKRPRSSHE